MPEQGVKPEVLTARRLGSSDLERVRLWRNSEHVRMQMASKNIISESEQREWFAEISGTQNEYFVYSYFGEDVGLLSMKPGVQDGFFEPGIYCGEKKFLDHQVNFFAAVWLYDYAFLRCQMEMASAQVLSTNLPALRLNKFLGFVEGAQQPGKFVALNLSRERYLTQRERFLRFTPRWSPPVEPHNQ